MAAGGRRNPNVPGLAGHEREMSCCVSKTYLLCGRVLVDMGTGLDWLELMSLGDNQIMAKVSC